MTHSEHPAGAATSGGGRAEPRPKRRSRTRRPGPARLSARAGVAVVLLGVLCAMAVTGTVSVRHDISRLRTSVAERAAVADQLRFALADLDAQRADTLAPGTIVVSPTESVVVGNQINALITARQRRTQVSDLMRQLSADTRHADRIHAMLDALGQYDDLSGRASYVDDQHADRPPGRPPQITVSMNVQAGFLMTDTLLPDADALSRAYQAQAADLRTGAHDAAVRWALVVGLLGAVTLLYLLWWQRELSRDYRRRLNPALAVVTAAVLAVALAGTVVLGSVAGSVSTAEREGLRPWDRLAEARAVAAQAAAAESRWFVQDPAFAVQDQVRFDAMIKELDTLLTPDGYATPAERPAYQDVLTRFGHFRTDDRTLRQERAAGRIDQAAQTLTEVARGDVAFDFWDFATTLDGLAGSQLNDFTAHVDDARGSLDLWPALPAGALGVAVGLVFAGLQRRYAEYR